MSCPNRDFLIHILLFVSNLSEEASVTQNCLYATLSYTKLSPDLINYGSILDQRTCTCRNFDPNVMFRIYICIMYTHSDTSFLASSLSFLPICITEVAITLCHSVVCYVHALAYTLDMHISLMTKFLSSCLLFTSMAFPNEPSPIFRTRTYLSIFTRSWKRGRKSSAPG